MINIDDFEIIEEEKKEEWCIKDDLAADWAIEKIKEIKEEYERFEAVSKAKMQQIEDKLQKEKDKADRQIEFFKSKLLQYFDTVKAKETKTQKTYKLPSGTLRFKKPKYVFEYDKDKLLDYIKRNNMTDYIKTKEVLNWSDFKEKLTIMNGKIINKDTGEVIENIEGLKVIQKPCEFDVKF